MFILVSLLFLSGGFLNASFNCTLTTLRLSVLFQPSKVRFMEGTKKDEGLTERNAVLTIVEREGSSYFVVDGDLRNGDRRADGKFMADFFTVVEGRERMKTKRNLYDDAVYEREAQRCSKRKVNYPLQCAGGKETGRSEEETSSNNVPRPEEKRAVAPLNVCPPRLPDKGIRCAGRNCTSRLLWLHEFFIVKERLLRKPKIPSIYQALQFLLGAHLPVGVVGEMTETMRREIWVLGVRYVPSSHVRKFSRRLKGYMFHTELNDDDADIALYGSCPEIVRVDNWLKWHPMSVVLRDVPRIVHADDVKERRVHVVGREKHYVCGVTAVHDLQCDEFRLSRLARANFCMYPEERSGMELNSPSMMWEHIEGVFSQIRHCMRSARQGTSSASFHMPFPVSYYEFWKVCKAFC